MEYPDAGPSGLLGALKLAKNYGRYYWRRRYTSASKTEASKSAKEASVELKESGFIVFENYFTQNFCEKAIQSIETLFQRHTQYLQRDSNQSDHRLRVRGVSLPNEIKTFHSDPLLREVGNIHVGQELKNAFTLTARLDATKNNLGSGGGWHRDAFYVQYKAMVYLTDVGQENGPFQIFEKSHKFGYTLFDNWLMGAGSGAYRFDDQMIDKLLASKDHRLKTLTAKAGTVILFDSSAIHRGKPIQSGTRYALTNYYYPVETATDERMSAIGPILTL